MSEYLRESLEKSLNKRKKEEEKWKKWVNFFQYSMLLFIAVFLASFYAKMEPISDFFYALFIISVAGFSVGSFQGFQWNEVRVSEHITKKILKNLKKEK